MKIKLSKSQWESIGRTAGWMKTALRRDFGDMLSDPSDPDIARRETWEQDVDPMEDASLYDEELSPLKRFEEGEDVEHTDLDDEMVLDIGKRKKDEALEVEKMLRKLNI